MREITAKIVEEQQEEGKKLNVIDVRELDEVREGMIPGALHMPLNSIPARYLELDKNEEYMIICHAGGRSYIATQFLEQHGYKVINIVDGMEGWKGPLVK